MYLGLAIIGFAVVAGLPFFSMKTQVRKIGLVTMVAGVVIGMGVIIADLLR